jgi:hypothetical protein
VRAYRDRMRRRLLEGPGFPVLGACSDPLLRRAALLSWQGQGDSLTGVVLLFGDPFSPSGPAVTVLTATAAAPPVDADALLDDEQRRLVEHTGSLAGVRDPGPRSSRSQLLRVQGVDLAAEVRHEGLAWATVVYPPALPGVRAAVVGRGVAVEDLTLGRIDDLAPLVTAGEQLLDEVVARGPGPPRRAAREMSELAVPVQPEPLGLQAHDLLLAAALGPRHRLWSPRDFGPVWERAVAMQVRLAGQTHDEAEVAITQCVQHAGALAEHAPWFADPALRGAAQAELVRWTAFASQVPSLPAMHAWEAVGRLPGLRHEALQEWLACWRQWVAARGG